MTDTSAVPKRSRSAAWSIPPPGVTHSVAALQPSVTPRMITGRPGSMKTRQKRSYVNSAASMRGTSRGGVDKAAAAAAAARPAPVAAPRATFKQDWHDLLMNRQNRMEHPASNRPSCLFTSVMASGLLPVRASQGEPGIWCIQLRKTQTY